MDDHDMQYLSVRRPKLWSGTVWQVCRCFSNTTRQTHRLITNNRSKDGWHTGISFEGIQLPRIETGARLSLPTNRNRKFNTSDEAKKIHETCTQVLEHAGFTLSRFFSNFLKESPKDTTMLGWNIFADVLSVKSINCLEFSSPRKLTSLIARCCEMTVIVFLYIFLVKRSLCLSFSVIKLCKFFPSFFLAASSDKLCRAQWNLIFKTTSRP